MRSKKKVIASKFFNFLHYHLDGVHIFSTELINGIQKRIDKDVAMRFEDMALQEYYEKKEKKRIKKEMNYFLEIAASKLTCESNKSLFLHNINIEVKRLSKNRLTVEDLSERVIDRLISISKNKQLKAFCI